jgi:hypothetical protein
MCSRSYRRGVCIRRRLASLPGVSVVGQAFRAFGAWALRWVPASVKTAWERGVGLFDGDGFVIECVVCFDAARFALCRHHIGVNFSSSDGYILSFFLLHVIFFHTFTTKQSCRTTAIT